MRVKCPNCAHVWATDHGVVSHTYSGWTEDELRRAREGIDMWLGDNPLPLPAVLPADLVDRWGVQPDLWALLDVLADGTQLPPT